MIATKRETWQIAYQRVLFERDGQKLRDAVDAAEAAIFIRCQRLSDGPGDGSEKKEIKAALEELRIIKKERVKFPDWRFERSNPQDPAPCS